jgi:hypothetical protein
MRESQAFFKTCYFQIGDADRGMLECDGFWFPHAII